MPIEAFDFRLVKSGKHIEVYEYKSKKIVKGYTRGKRPRAKKNNNILETGTWEFDDIIKELEYQEKEQKQKQDSSIQRTRTNIRRITNANPQLNKFLTLTFAKSMPDLNKANKLFNTAMKRILRAKPEFEYIAVVEFQKDTDYYGRKKEHGGSVHYHLLCNIETILPRTQFEWERWFQMRYWKNGFVKVKDVNTITNMGAYFCKYLGKDMFDERMFNKKKFFCSQTLNKPVELTGNKARRFFNTFVKPTLPVFERTFENKYSGLVDYSAYILHEDIPVKFEHMSTSDKQHVITRQKICPKVSKDMERGI